MKLELIKLDEDTGICELDVDEEGKQMLIEKGFNALLWEVLEELETKHERETREGFL